MITRTTRAPLRLLEQVADFAFEDKSFMREALPSCNTKGELVEALKNPNVPWMILAADRPLALFSLYATGTHAIIERLAISEGEPVGTFLIELSNDFSKMKMDSLTLRVSDGLAHLLTGKGLAKSLEIVQLSGPIVETKLMPILQLTNPSAKDIPTLAKLMHESYSSSKTPPPTSVDDVEKRLRDIIGGAFGPFLGDCSFISGSTSNVVSACFVTIESTTVARVAEMFTHPLYRARGLATTEIASSMNMLIKRGFSKMTAWVPANDDVTRRLFGSDSRKMES